MIESHADDEGLVRRLSVKARKLAEAHAEARLRARRGDPARWRRADLLWPLLGKDDG